jgi:hypothetical protein
MNDKILEIVYEKYYVKHRKLFYRRYAKFVHDYNDKEDMIADSFTDLCNLYVKNAYLREHVDSQGLFYHYAYKMIVTRLKTYFKRDSNYSEFPEEDWQIKDKSLYTGGCENNAVLKVVLDNVFDYIEKFNYDRFYDRPFIKLSIDFIKKYFMDLKYKNTHDIFSISYKFMEHIEKITHKRIPVEFKEYLKSLNIADKFDYRNYFIGKDYFLVKLRIFLIENNVKEMTCQN